MSQLSRLARLLAVKEKDAWEFYLQVKKEFKENPPKIEMVVECIELKSPSQKTPQIVASFLKQRDDSNLGNPPNSGLKSQTENAAGTAFGAYKKQKKKNRSGDLSGYSGRFGALRPGRDTRDYTRQFATCPHGVLKTKKCAICDPAEFAESGS